MTSFGNGETLLWLALNRALRSESVSAGTQIAHKQKKTLKSIRDETWLPQGNDEQWNILGLL